MVEKMRDKIIEILESISDEYDYEKEENIMTAQLFDSMMMVNFVLALTEEFEIEVDYKEINSQNFDSVDKIVAYVASKKG